MRRKGFVIVAVITMLVVLSVLITAYLALTRVEISSTRSVADSTTGFYAAEAGLNLRAESVRGAFSNWNVPVGTSPSSTDPCVGSNQGSGTYACVSYSLQGRTVSTYIVPKTTGNPPGVVIPAGDTFAGLVAQEYAYTLYSVARSPSENRVESRLSMELKTRLVPMFQFAAFYAGDLEIGNGPPMVLTGPVHTNSNMYLSTYQTLQIKGPVSAVGNLYHGRKLGDPEYNDSCATSGVSIANAANNLVNLAPNLAACNAVLASNISAYGGKVKTGIGIINIPGPESLRPAPGSGYWDNADVRIALVLPTAGAGVVPDTANVQVRNQDNTLNSAATSALTGVGCLGVLGSTPTGNGIGIRGGSGVISVTPSPTQYPAYNTPPSNLKFFNWRERTSGTPKTINMLNVDVQGLLQCIYANPNAFKPGGGFNIDDTSNGGLVIFLTVIGPDSGCTNYSDPSTCTKNNYGVRILNGAVLKATSPGAPAIKGLTMVTDQAAYVKGDYNCKQANSGGTACASSGSNVWKPAAIMADSLNVLSNSWTDKTTAPTVTNGPVASTTTLNTAFLAGVDVTVTNSNNGGLQNYPRFHENWNSATLYYKGSFVSLGIPSHVNGPFGNQYQHYLPPTRNWDYESLFNNPANLPPMTPRAVFLKQELFVRQFEQ